jgi:regulatory protein
MKITDIKQQQKNPNRLNVYVGGQFAFGVSAEIRFEKKLEIDQELSEKQVEDLISADQTERLLNKALKFLSFRPRSEKEIRDHLLRKGKLKEVKSEAERKQYEVSVEDAANRLKKLGQIDDQKFVSWWVDQRTRFKPRGLNVLRSELFSKGVAKEIIDEQVRFDEENQFKLALVAAKKKVDSYRKLDTPDFKVKLGQFLARRGFGWAIIKKVVDTLERKELK